MAHHSYSVEAQSFADLIDILKQRVQGDVIKLRGRFSLSTVPEVRENEPEVLAQIFRQDPLVVTSVEDHTGDAASFDNIAQLCAVGSRYDSRTWGLNVCRKSSETKTREREKSITENTHWFLLKLVKKVPESRRASPAAEAKQGSRHTVQHQLDDFSL
jgi:hypothetical protein